MRIILILAGLVFFSGQSYASPQSIQDLVDYVAMAERCIDDPPRNLSFEEKIAMCNAWVQEVESGGYSDKERSRAYAYRGRMYGWPFIEKSNADFAKAIELDPKNAFALLARGSYAFFYGDPTRSLADILKAVELEPKFGDHITFARISILYERLGNIEQAIVYSRKYLELMENEWHRERLHRLERQLREMK